MPQRPLCIHGVIPCGLNWPRLGKSFILLQQRVPPIPEDQATNGI